MLELIDIKKDYDVAGEPVHALKGVSLKFRKNEFVSILGASGCGKTTLLNIIGGLDKYTSGDLVIAGRSTKEYKDGDWDTYRNHSVGFIFQSYHLIPHQTILQNVELALTISGVDKEERTKRAIEALEKVGLGDKIRNRPNQLSGGQAQRVAIARALINDPEIVLADEPTGALDSKTSVQIMELLKEISKDRLVIMVTHNPELAEKYSTRIIRLLDGEVIDDTMPYDGDEPVKESIAESEEQEESKRSKGKKKKASMSFGMAFMLSLKNLLSKSKRTVMVSVAGSIGIIGVSMVLAISSGVQGYIASMEDDMLSGYPLTVTETAINFDSLMTAAMETDNLDLTRLDDKVYVDSSIESLMRMSNTMTTNTITDEYVNYIAQMPEEYYNAITYTYGYSSANNIYLNFKLDDNDPGEEMSVAAMRAMYSAVLNEVAEKEGNDQYAQFAQIIPTVRTFSQIPDNYEYILSQYDILATSLDKTENLSQEELKEIFESKDSIIMVLDHNATADLYLGQFGYFTQEEFLNYAKRAKSIADGKTDTSEYDELIKSYLDGKDFDFFIDKGDEHTFTWYPNDTVYRKLSFSEAMSNGFVLPSGETLEPAEYTYNPYSAGFAADRDKTNDVDLKVKIILQRKENVTYGSLGSGFYYTEGLVKHVLETGVKSKIVEFMNKESDGALKFLPYKYHYTFDGELKNPAAAAYLMQSSGMMSMFSSAMGGDNANEPYAMLRVESSFFGGNPVPSGIYFYVKDFKLKDKVTSYLDKWNDAAKKRDTASYTLDGKNYILKNGGDGSVSYTKDGSLQVVALAALSDEEFNKHLENIKAELRRGGDVTYTSPGGEASPVTLRGVFSWIEKSDDGDVEHTVILSDSDAIEYTDTVGLIIAMVNTMIEMITIALVAFTALSLVVSTVMVGIITYVSVVERIKEIGILRAVGARKKDIKRLFIAETFIIGLAAGIVGIAVTYILSLILNLIIASLAPVTAIAALPFWQALIMIGISVALTLISGLIPASAAAKKDPVVALRTE